MPFGSTTNSGYSNCGVYNWRAYAPGSSVSVITHYGYAVYEETQRLNNIFSYGFGDLEIYDHFIATTPASTYRGLEITSSVLTNTAGYLPGWKRGPTPPSNVGQEFPSNVEGVSGGEMKHTVGWIERSSSRTDCVFLEVDIEGQIFRNGNDGPETLTREVDCEYREFSSSTWVKAPGFPMQLSNGDTTAFLKTFGWGVPAGRYVVRMKKNSPDETDARNTVSLNFYQVKAFGLDQPESYVALNRLGVQVQASSQLNGALDRWSSMVKAKCWVYVGSVYDGSYPSSSNPNWSWQHTENPGWWFLYFARGGFLDSSAPKGWNTENTAGVRLFGMGLPYNQIDLPKIFRFAKWCDQKALRVGLVINQQASCLDTAATIVGAGRGNLHWSSGKLSVFWTDISDVPVAQFGMGNIIAGSFSITYDATTPVDEFIGSFDDETDALYGQKQIRAVVPGVAFPVNQQTIQLTGVTNLNQAERELRLKAADKKYHPRKISFTTTMDGLIPQRGSQILLAHDMTGWAKSGRLLDIDASGTLITLPIEVEAGWIQIRLPDGQYVKYQVNAGRVHTLPTALPDFPDHFPEDYIFQAGVTATPGKKCRVLSVSPQEDRTVPITCTDDFEEYYLCEYSTDQPDPSALDRIPAKVYNVTVENRSDGDYLCWETSGCLGAFVSASHAGSRGELQIPGNELKLPSYQVGTTVTFITSPWLNGLTASSSSGETLVWTKQ